MPGPAHGGVLARRGRAIQTGAKSRPSIPQQIARILRTTLFGLGNTPVTLSSLLVFRLMLVVGLAVAIETLGADIDQGFRVLHDVGMQSPDPDPSPEPYVLLTDFGARASASISRSESRTRGTRR